MKDQPRAAASRSGGTTSRPTTEGKTIVHFRGESLSGDRLAAWNEVGSEIVEGVEAHVAALGDAVTSSAGATDCQAV